MADDNWQKVREVFDAALQQKPEERQSYINQVCSDDKTLLMEIESLFSSFDRAEDFMETPAVATVADIIEPETKTLESGKCFAHYEVIKQIGTGGMGKVYLAQDKKLYRKVAVKILNERFSQDRSNLRRFIHEAKAASALNHPNILVIHEIGETDETHYIVSEFIKGETLREVLIKSQMSLAEVLEISIQIANALTTAHGAHLIHRDIKPENVMIRPDGLVKVLDFGLAKLIEEKNKSFLELRESSGKRSQTAEGIILGTVNYMSPEQAKADRVDERTDIFSLGVVIYEMLTGRTPFAGNSMSETSANLIYDEPAPLSRFASNVPDELQRIVSKTLRKNKDERYQTMKEVLTDLKELKENLTFDEKLERSHSPENGNATEILQATTGDANKQTAETQNSLSQQIKQHKSLAAFALAALLIGSIALGYYYFYAGKTASSVNSKKSIVVLPLKPVTAENREPIYEFGIADSLILKLSSAKGLVVRPLSATRRYADIEQDAIAAGREQKVDYVLASNYQIADGKIRITSQLINVQSGLVEEVFKVEQENLSIFSVQDAVAANIGGSLLKKLNREPNNLLAKRYTTNEEAYRLYLQGTALSDKRTQKEVRKAIEYFEQAVRLDPNYALAYARLANAQTATVLNLGGDADEHYPKAKAAIEKARAIDDNLAEAHSYLGEIKSDFEWDFAGAEREHRKAIALNPNSAVAHRMYSLLLTYLGRHDESIAESKTAIDLEPASVMNHLIFGRSLLFARRYDEAITELERTAEMYPEYFFAHQSLNIAYRFKGDYDRTFESFVKTRILAGEEPDKINLWKTIYAKTGWRGITERQLEQAKEAEKNGKPNYNQLANFSSELGQREQAFAYLEKASVHHRWAMVMLKVHPRYDSLRDDPRFDELLRRVGLK
jgi:serine/threonine-protein kinase